MKTVKHFRSLIFSTALFSVPAALAQQSNLCVGAYYSEEEGARKLNRVLKSMHSVQDWQAHADSVRGQIRAGMQMEKFPTKTPLNPKFRHKKILDGYTVENVVFESLPGFFVTGNLYRPVGNFKNKSLAVIASPHRHLDRTQNYRRFCAQNPQRCAGLAKNGGHFLSLVMGRYRG